MKVSRILAVGGFVWLALTLTAIVLDPDAAPAYVVAAIVLFTGSSLADLIERGRDV